MRSETARWDPTGAEPDGEFCDDISCPTVAPCDTNAARRHAAGIILLFTTDTENARFTGAGWSGLGHALSVPSGPMDRFQPKSLLRRHPRPRHGWHTQNWPMAWA